MEHIIQFGVNIDEEEIKKTVQKHYNEYCEKIINDYVLKAILGVYFDRDIKSQYARRDIDSEIEQKIITKLDVRIDKIIDQNKDAIIERASDKLVKSIRASKKGKEIFNKLEQEIER